MKKKKILHIVESFGSGVFSFLVDLINQTDKEFDITIAYGVRAETIDNFKELFSERVKLIKVENFTRSISPIKDSKALKEVKLIIKEIKPDIIHLHSSKAGIIGRFATNGRKVKMFYNPHGFSFLMKNSSKLKRSIYWLIEKIAALRKCTIIGCSKGEYQEALKLTKNAICINNGVNIEKLYQNKKILKERKLDIENIKVYTLGRIGFQKNPELFNNIAGKFPNIQFTWIGEGELRDKLKNKNIRITGWLQGQAVFDEISSCDIFILPSLWEGLPISLLESMFFEKICIVSNCIGNRDVIKNEINGFVCDKLIDYEIVLKKIMNKEYDLDKIVKQAKSDIIEEYNINLMCKKYSDIYRK